MRTWTKRRPLRRDVATRPLTGANGGAIDRGDRTRIERRAAQRVEGGNRGVDVERGGPVERQIQVFFVFVLAEDAAARGRRHGGGERQRDGDLHHGQ
jgi:hypothetical protein